VGLSRKIGTLGAIAALGVLAVAAPAGAATGSPGHPEVYAGTAQGTALVLNLFGHTVTEGVSTVKAASSQLADALGIGAVGDGTVYSQEHAAATAADQAQTLPEACATPALPALPAPLPQPTLGLACASSAANTENATPWAAAVGKVADLDLNAAGLVGTLTQTLQPVLNQLQPVFGTLQQIQQIAPQINVQDTVGQLLEAVGTQRTLHLSLGSTTSFVRTEASTVTSNSSASGGDIQILGLDALPNSAPLAEIQIGASSAQVAYNRRTGGATPSFDPALVKVIVNPLPTTGLAQQTLTVAPGQSLTILQGTPLASTITVAAGSSTKNADGSVTATASGVELRLLQGVGASSTTATDGGVDLALAKTTATGGGTPAAAAVAGVATPARSTSLPFTGSNPVLPLAGAGLLSVALVGRRPRRMFR
jgi:hypothetical protein